jgi:hypothetical protein
MEFWKAAASATTSTPLTPELIEETWATLKRQADEALAAPYECPHKSVVLPFPVAKKIPPEGIECPWGCGMRLVGPGSLP